MFLVSVIFTLASVYWADADILEKRQSSNTTASFVSSVTSVPIPSQAPTVNSTAYDLTKHYCRLWRHSSMSLPVRNNAKTDHWTGAYVNGSIYIDSGNTVRIPRHHCCSEN